MAHNNLRPNRSGRYRQGYIDPSQCKKYVGDTPITYRSSWEKTFVQWLERSPKVEAWGSESVPISYIYSDGKQHTYYPDFVVKMNGEIYIIEIKPANQCRPPSKPYPYAIEQWNKNQAKWSAAREWCEERGMKFMIITENTIGKL